MKPAECAVIYKFGTNTVSRIEYRDRAGDLAHVTPARDERMIRISASNIPNLDNILLGLGIRR